MTVWSTASFISIEQAKKNLAREIPAGQSFEDAAAGSRAAWSALLAKAELLDAGNATEEEGEFAKGTWYALFPLSFTAPPFSPV